MKTLRRYRQQFGWFMTCLMALSSMQSQAATYTWQPVTGANNWNVSGNWVVTLPSGPAAAPVPGAAGDIISLIANSTAAQTITLDASSTLGILNIGDPTTGFFGYTLTPTGGSTLTFDNNAAAAQINKAAAATATDTIAANIILGAAGNANLNISNLNANTTGLLVLSGDISETGGAHNLVVSGVAASSNGVTVLTGNNSFTGSVSLGSGTLRAVGAQSLNSSAVNQINLSGGTLALQANGDGTQAVENINYGDNVTVSGNSTITVDRIAGLTGTFITPLNKTIQLGDLSIGAQTLTVTPANGYGLQFTGATTLTGASTFAVGGGGATDVVQGLTLTGIVDDGAGNFGFTKSGTGTLVLANTGNTFGSSSVITVSDGILQGNANGSFGDATNSINITANSLTKGVRFNYTDTVSRTIRANAASSGLDVTRGNTITLANPLDFSATANALGKNDAGRLILAAGAPTIAGAAGAWNGAITVSQGALQVSSGAALGGAVATTVSGMGATLELNNVGSISELINISNGNQTNKGVDGFGVIQAIAGTNTLTGTVAITAALGDNQRSNVIVAGVKNGATLNLSGAVNAVTFNNNAGTNRNVELFFLSEGTGIGTINNAITNIAGTPTTNRDSIRFAGTGTWNATAANFYSGMAGGTSTTAATSVFITAGTFELSGAGTFGNPGAGNLAGRVDVSSNALFRINESAGEANRLNNRQMRLLGGGDLTYIGGNAVDTSENIGQQVAFNIDRGNSIITIDPSATNSATLNTGTVGAVARSNAATLRLAGDNIGSAAGAGVGVFVGGNAAGGLTFVGQLGATATTQKSLVPWALVENPALAGGIGFATADSALSGTTTGTSLVRGLASSESLTSVSSLFTTNLVAPLASNLTLAASDVTGMHLTANSLRLDGGADLNLCDSIFTLDSGGLLVTSATSVISNGYLTTGGNRDLIVHALADTTISAPIVGTAGGLTKSGAGIISLDARASYTGLTAVNQGTLLLNGGVNTLVPGQDLFIQEGAKVDINGNSQFFNQVFTGGAEITARGAQFAELTNTGAAATVTIGGANVSYNGKVTGNITLARAALNGGYGAWNVYQPLEHTGATILTGGITQLLDAATLLNTSRIDIQNGTFIPTNGTYTSGTPANRVSDTAPINLTAGMIQFRAPQGEAITEKMGALTLGAGMSLIDPAEAGGGLNATHIEFASLARTAAQHGTLRFDGNVNGAIGSTSNVFFTTAPTLTNNLIGGWAMIDRDFATYTATGGVTPLQNAGTAGYNRTNYTDATTNGINAAVAGENIRMTGTGTTAAGHSVTLNGNRTLNALAYIAQNTAGTANFNLNGNTLTVQSGGLSLSPNASSDTPISLSVTNGNLTAGAPGVGGELFIHHLPFPGTDNAERRSVNLGATVTDNAGGAVALVLNSQNHGGGTARRSTLYITGDNEHTGGTFVNSGRIVLNTAGANGTSVVAIPGDLTIIGGIQQQTAAFDGNNLVQLGEVFAYSTGQIATTSNVTLKGTSRLDFSGAPGGITASPNAVIGATLASVTFDNTGGQAPVLNLGAGNLILNGNITAGGTNVSTNATSTISRTGTTGVIDFGGATRTIHVTPVTVDGVAVNELLPSLNINVPLTNSTGINKTGNGILQLTAQSTFNGNLNLNAGGITIGANSTPAVRPLPGTAPVMASGPLGNGTLNIAAGTSLLSSGAFSVGNAVNVNGDFTFNGTNNLSLLGDTNLNGATRAIDVRYWQMTATLGGIVSNGGITKNGNGTLFLNNNNTYAGGTTLNAGTLVGQVPGGGSPTVSPFGTGAIAYNGGFLSMRTQSGDAIFGNDINVNSAVDAVFLDVQGGNQITMGNLNMPLNGSNNPTVKLVNVGGTIGSTLRFTSTNLDLNGDGGVSPVRVAGQFQNFNISSGVTTIFTDVFCNNNEPLNIGLGNLLLGGANCFTTGTTITASGSGAAPLVNATTAIYGAGQSVTFTGAGINYSILPQTNGVIGGATGGLQSTATLVGSGTLTSGLTFGRGLTSYANSVLPNDATLDRVASTSAISTLGVFNGYINITTGGEYKFLLGSDDFSSLVIDGIEVGRDIGAGHGVNDTARGSITLAAGQHTITYKINTGTGAANAGSGGGARLLYSGADTAASGTNGGWQAVPTSALSYFTGPANAGNNFYNAAQIDNDYVVSAGSSANLNGLGTDYNSTVKSLTLGNGATVSASNDLSAAVGASVGGTGFVGVKGLTTVGTGAVLAPTTGHLYLIGGVSDSGNGITKTGNGTLSLNNSAAFTGALNINDGTVMLRENDALPTGGTTVAAASTTTFAGGATTNGSNVATVTSTTGMYPGMAIVGSAGIPAGTTVVSITNGTTFVMSANATATGASTITHANAASLDLNGVASSAGRNLTLNGAGTASQLGALYNSSASAASVAGTVNLATASTISGYGEISLDGVVTSAGGITLTKAGPDTLTLTAANAATMLGGLTIANNGGVVNNGALNSGVSGALGAGVITVGTNAALNLNGNNLSQAITTNGTSIANIGPNGNSLGNIINSSVPRSFATRNTVAVESNMMQLANTANTATISNNITMATGTLGIGSNTFATGGDIIVSGIISGGQALTKVGGNTLTLQGVNTYTGGTAINYGSLRLENGALINATGGGTVTVQTGGSLVIDNSTTAVQNRLNNGTATAAAAANKPLVLNGGTFTINGHATTGVTETTVTAATGTISGINIGQGANRINLVNNGSNVTLATAGAGTNNGAIINGAGGTVLVTGKNLGQTAGATTTNLLVAAASGTRGQNGNGNGNTVAIIPWLIVDDTNTGSGTSTGVSFGTPINNAASTAVNAAGIRPLAAANYSTALTANTNVNMTAGLAVAANANLNANSLTIATTGALALNIPQGSTFNLQSGGILATQTSSITGSGVISASVDGNNSSDLYIHTHGSGTTLTINAAIGSNTTNNGRIGEVIKAGSGNLILGGANFTTTNTRVQEGTLTLNNASAIYYRPVNGPANNAFNSSVAGPTLQVNGGATLNMNGFDLPLNNLNSINPAGVQGSLSGGTITNTGANKDLTVSSTTNNTWAGVIAGDIDFAKYGRDTFTIANSNTYDGTTIIGGGATTLVDLGALRNTSSVTINQGTLIWNDNGSQSDAYRLGSNTGGSLPAVTFNGGGFQYNGRFGEDSVANLGAVTIASGSSDIRANAATIGSATVSMSSFTRSGNATINFAGSILGDDGNIVVTGAAPTNYNGIVGGWAISSTANPYTTVGAGDFVTYDPGSGFRAIVDYKTTGGITYASGNANQPALGNTVFSAGNNVLVNSNTTLAAGNNVANSMVLGVNANIALSFANPTDTLFIQSGGIIGRTDNNSKTIGGTTVPTAANLNGYLTAGNADGSAGLGNSGNELFIHNLGNTLIVNSQVVNNGAAPVTLVVDSGNTGAAIRFNNTNTFTGATIFSGGDVRLNSSFAPAIANSTSITINGGNQSAADSASNAQSRVLFEQNNQLNAAANVTVNSGAANLDLNNFNQTLNSVTFNNIGGFTGGSPGVGPHVRTGTGTLTLSGGISATNLENTSTIPFIAGTLALTAGQHTVLVDPVSAAPQQIGLTINAAINGVGSGINKTGNGVLNLTGTSTYNGPTNVTAGTLVLGGVIQDAGTDTSMSIANSLLDISSGATVDLRGGNAIIGSLAGAGTVTNSVYAMINNTSNGNPATLIVGADNTSGANFSGLFTNFINGANETSGFNLNVTKVGTGNQIISGDNALAIANAAANGDINNTGTLDIQDGTITVSGANGSLGFTTVNLKAGATLILDDAVANANRLGGYRLTDSASGDTLNDTTTGRTINMQGGTINFNAGATLMNEGTSAVLGMATNAGVGTVVLNSGASTWNFNGAGGVTVHANAFTAGAGSLLLNAGATQTLGRAAAGAGSINVYVAGGMASQGTGPLQPIGTAVLAPAGVQGNIVGGVRPDMTGLDSTGSGFVTYDRFGYRLLTAAEYSAFPVQPDSPLTTGATTNPTNPAAAWAAPNPTVSATYTGNALVTENQSFTTNTTIASLRLDNGGGLTSNGGSLPDLICPENNFNALGTLNTTTVSSGAIVANVGNTGLNGGAVSSATLRLTVDAGAVLDADTFLIGTGTGTAITMSGAGTLNLNKQVFMGSNTDAGQLVVNGGTVNLNAGPNTLTVVNSAGVSLADTLTINAGGTVDMKGFDQTIGSLSSVDPLPGGGGTLTNSGALANLYTNSNSTFGGHITGAVNLVKTGTGNLTLTDTSTYAGSTTIQGGILILQDSATVSSSTYNINGGQLRWDNRTPSLSEVVQRTPIAATYNLNHGTFMDLARASNTQITETLGTVNSLSSMNELRVDGGGAANRTLAVTTLNVTPGSQVHFTTGNGTLGQAGANPNLAIGNFNASTMMINGVIPWAIAGSDQIAMYNPVVNPLTGLAYGVATPNQTTNAAVAITGTNAAAAVNAAGPTSITVTPAQAATVAVGTYLSGTGVPSGVLVTGVNTGTGVITVAPWTATAAVAANQAFTFTGGTQNYAGTFTTATTTQNVNQGGAAAIDEAATVTSRVFNSLRFSSTTGTNLNSARQETVRLEAGVIITNQANINLNRGFLTAGSAVGVSQPLYIHANSNTFGINAQIVNNGAGVTSLVKSGAGALTLVPSIAAGGSQTGAATNATVVGSNVITLSAAMTTTPVVGQKVYGPGIPNGATVVSVAGPAITISAPAFATTNAGAYGFGDAQVLTGTNAAVANAAAGFTTMTVTPAQAATLFVGASVQSAGMSTTISAIDTATGVVTLAAWTASAAVAANTPVSFGTATQINTNNAYTGTTTVNGQTGNTVGGALNLNGVAGTRALGSNTNLTINSGGVVAMSAAGNIAPNTDVTINGGGTLTFTPVTAVEPTSGGINAINSLTFNNNAGGARPTVTGGTNGILTLKSGAITATGDNQGTTATVLGVLNFGQVALGSWASGVTTVTVGDVAGFVAGQTVSGTGIAPGSVINSISGDTITLSLPTIATSAATGSLLAAVNHASGSSTAMTPTLAVNSTNVNELTADLAVTAVIANSPSWTNLAGGGAPLTKTGNGNLVLSGASTFNNGTVITAGTLTLGASTNVTTQTAGVAAAFVSGPVGTGTLTLNNGTTITADSTARTLNNNLVVAGDITFGGQQAGNNVTINGTTDLGIAGPRGITVSSPQVTATLAGVVSGATSGITKNGNGTLVLGNSTLANTYVGTNTINTGLVRAGGVGALGATTNDLIVKCNATLNVNGFNQTIDGLTGDSATMGGLITNSGAAATLTIGQNNEASATFAGTITNAANALNVTKTGTGTQILTGLNTYTGTTTVNAGVLQVGTATTGNASTLGSGAVTVNSGGTLAGTGHILAPAAGNTMTIASGGILAPGDTTAGTLSASNANMTLGSTVGSGLAPLAVTTAATSPSTVAGAVNLSVANGGQIQLGITSATYNSSDVFTQLNSGTYVDALTTFGALAVGEQQKWDATAWTQQTTGLVGSTTLTYTGNSASIGLNNVSGNGSLYVGQTVTGTGIAAGTTITAITTGANPTITLSNAITASSTALTIGSTTQNVTVVEGLNSIVVANPAGLAVGDTVSGYGIPAGAQIASITGNVITLKDGATSAAIVPLASTYAPTVNFAGPGSHDHLNISGTLSLGTNASGLVQVLDNGYVASAMIGDVFNLLDWATLTSGWSTANLGTNFRVGGTGGGDLDLPTLSIPDQFWDVSAFATRGILVVVPEPSRALLMLFGLIGLFLRRRRNG